MKRWLTIVSAIVFIGTSVFGLCLSLSCGSSNEPEANDGQLTFTLEEVIQEVFQSNPGPQASYIINGVVEQIENRKLFIKRADKMTVIADIDEGISAETVDETQEGNILKPMSFQDIIIGDFVKIWVQIMSDGSFEQTRLLINTP